MRKDSILKLAMLKLYLIRHAKSSWTDQNLSDFDRPLNKRGRNAAPIMANRLIKESEIPGIIYSSPAQRAKETVYSFCHQLNIDESKINFNEDIYEASIRNIISIIEKTDSSHKTVWLFGHNPSIGYSGNYFCNNWNAHVPTCGIVGIEFDVDHWMEISKDSGIVTYFDFPKKELD